MTSIKAKRAAFELEAVTWTFVYRRLAFSARTIRTDIRVVSYHSGLREYWAYLGLGFYLLKARYIKTSTGRKGWTV